MASSPITAWQIEGGRWKQRQTSSSWAPKSLWMVTAAMKSEDCCSWQENNDKPRQCAVVFPATLVLHIVRAAAFPVVTYGRKS